MQFKFMRFIQTKSPLFFDVIPYSNADNFLLENNVIAVLQT